MARRVSLQPDRMTNAQLYGRARTLVAAVRFQQQRAPRERERLLDELDRVILELQMRGTQLELDLHTASS